MLPNIASVFADTQFYSNNKHYYKYRERHGRFAQLIRSSKKMRSKREDKANNNKKEQNYINCIEQQEEDIENLKEELKD